MSRILAVDDAPDTLMLLEFDLVNEGYDVVTCPDGDSACQLLSKESFDLVLLDIYMPGLSGIDTLKWIKQQDAYKNIPVIMLSASDDENEIVTALEFGANDYVTKPYIAKVLLARIKTSLRLRQQTLTLESLANTDYLTELNNKGHFESLATHAISQMERKQDSLAIAMLDIDYFKAINDDYGHEMGDAVLKAFAKTMENQFRDYDVLGRVGGEEFAVCMPSTSLEEAYAACERFRESVMSLAVPASQHRTITFTVSIGLTSVNGNCGDYDLVTLMRQADQYLYQAKAADRNCIKSICNQSDIESIAYNTSAQSECSKDTFEHIQSEIGLANVLGDKSLFKEILVMFYEDHHQDGNKLQQAISEQQDQQLKHIIHTLKGVACSVGAMALFDSAKALDIAVNEKNSAAYQELYLDVAQHLTAVMSELEQKVL